MSSPLRRAASACLYSAVTGLCLAPGLALAQSSGAVQHADAYETPIESAPGADLGKAFAPPRKSMQPPPASHKMTARKGAKKPAKRRPVGSYPSAQAANDLPAPATLPAATTPPALVPTPATDPVEQTAGTRGRAGLQPQQPAPAYAAPAYVPPAAPQTEVERQLQELYRKDGRPMPEMDLYEFQSPPAANQPQASGQRGGGVQSPGRGAARSGKPNFLERLFGVGRARNRAPSAAAAPARSAPSESPSRLPPDPYQQARQPQSLPPFRPNQAAPNQPAQVTPQPAMKEPAPLAPAETSTPTLALPHVPRPTDSQPLLDESGVRDDDESLDLSTEGRSTITGTAPEVLPEQTTDGAAESPYTGLTIRPNETEGDIARDEEVRKPYSESATPAARSERAIAPPAETLAEPAAKAEPIRAEQPAAAAQKPAAAPRLFANEDDEESLDLEDEDSTPAPRNAASDERSLKKSEDKSALAPPASPKKEEKSAAQDAPLPPPPDKPDEKTARSETVAAKAHKGFKGYCPVILKDERRLVEARTQFQSDHRGRTYVFSSLEAKTAFEGNPNRYAPAGDGRDLVRLAAGDDQIDGSLEHAAWYRGRLYLFSSAETRSKFVDEPRKFSVNE